MVLHVVPHLLGPVAIQQASSVLVESQHQEQFVDRTDTPYSRMLDDACVLKNATIASESARRARSSACCIRLNKLLHSFIVADISGHSTVQTCVAVWFRPGNFIYKAILSFSNDTPSFCRSLTSLCLQHRKCCTL